MVTKSDFGFGCAAILIALGVHSLNVSWAPWLIFGMAGTWVIGAVANNATGE